jgi:hypothetical protein
MARSRRESHHSDGITNQKNPQLTSATKSASSGHRRPPVFARQIAGLTEALADIKMALTDAKEELASAEIEKLKKQFQRLADTVEFDGYKYDKGPDGSPKGAPYCPVCRLQRTMPSLKIFCCPTVSGPDVRATKSMSIEWHKALLRTPRNGSVKIVEQGAGTPVVFLHSGVGSAGEWRDVFSVWPTGYRLIAVDAFRGGSGPGLPGHRTLDDYADQVYAHEPRWAAHSPGRVFVGWGDRTARGRHRADGAGLLGRDRARGILVAQGRRWAGVHRAPEPV